MGWKASSLIIQPATDISHDQLLTALGFTSFTKINDEPFETAMYPAVDKVYIGTYNGNLIISIDRFPVDFFSISLSPMEKKLIQLFPTSEICAFSLQSTVNHWGFAIIKSGEKIRVKAGDYKGTLIDIGEPVQEEMELLNKSKLNEAGKRLYYLSKYNNKEYNTEDQVGENIVSDIIKRYTGTDLMADDKLLFDTNFSGYQVKPSPNIVYLDMLLTGFWYGRYTYGNGYTDMHKGKSEGFVLELTVSGGVIKGTCIDENKREDEAATIRGYVDGPFICFQKEYPYVHYFDETGQIQKKEGSTVVSYSGLYDAFKNNFKGIWHVETSHGWGEWHINKDTSG
ncbi:MAG: hypothetical protein ABI480_02135 [Chitinophagaceae bacterium]